MLSTMVMNYTKAVDYAKKEEETIKKVGNLCRRCTK